MSNSSNSNGSGIQGDEVLDAIAEYVCSEGDFSDEALRTARWCLVDSLGCALLALQYQECTKLLGPIVPEATVADGVPVPGTRYRLDPAQAAFNIGTMVRWLDYNDTWLAAEWGHPSDNLGAILAGAYWRNRDREVSLADIYRWMIQAHEIQGILALENSFNRVGLDHVLLVRVASTAVAARIFGGNHDQVRNALTHAFLDGGALRTYRHAPNTGSRKSWAAGDATSRAVRLALWALQGEMGYATPLTTDHWGFQDVLFKGASIRLAMPLRDYVMRNILFKVSFPAEFHGQTAVECALQLHAETRPRLQEIESIQVETQEPAIRIISKKGPLANPAARDHCLEYMIAVALIHGELNADHYEDQCAADPRIEALRQKMVVREEKQFSRDYLAPDKRSIANAIQILYSDGTSSERVQIDYPLGHRRRRNEAKAPLEEKFRKNARGSLKQPAIDWLLESKDSEERDACSLSDWLKQVCPDD